MAAFVGIFARPDAHVPRACGYDMHGSMNLRQFRVASVQMDGSVRARMKNAGNHACIADFEIRGAAVFRVRGAHLGVCAAPKRIWMELIYSDRDRTENRVSDPSESAHPHIGSSDLGQPGFEFEAFKWYRSRRKRRRHTIPLHRRINPF